MSRIFGPVRQMAYIVRDIDRAMDYWLKVVGVGPFFLLENHSSAGAQYRGKPTDMRISLAFAQSGPIQIELIQQLNDAPSLFRDFLDSGREGLQHLAFWTQTFDADMARYRDAGYSVVQTAGLNGPNNRNAFIVRQDDDELVIEISEISGTKGEFFRQIADAANGWDGSDPIRRIVP
jgi:Glyoxalase/Bleomycin resistance protein/Dioxygenase superfamily